MIGVSRGTLESAARDVPPSVRGQLCDPANPLWVAEGIRNVDALASASDSLLRAEAIGRVRALPGCSVMHYLEPLVMFFECLFRFFDFFFRESFFGCFQRFLRLLRPFGCVLPPERR
jgi:hypothetical protein